MDSLKKRSPKQAQAQHQGQSPNHNKWELSENAILIISCLNGLLVGLFMTCLVGYYLTGSITFHVFAIPDVTSLAKQQWHKIFPFALTKEELSRYDGRDPALPIFISIKGKVYDVTKGITHYGPNGGYHGFAGRDASRAFLDMCFSPECLSKGLEGLSDEELKTIDEWAEFYEKETKYPYVGELKKE